MPKPALGPQAGAARRVARGEGRQIYLNKHKVYLNTLKNKHPFLHETGPEQRSHIDFLPGLLQIALRVFLLPWKSRKTLNDQSFYLKGKVVLTNADSPRKVLAKTKGGRFPKNVLPKTKEGQFINSTLLLLLLLSLLLSLRCPMG